MLEVLRDHVKHGVGLLLIAVPESDLDLLEQLGVEGPDRTHQPEDLVPDFDLSACIPPPPLPALIPHLRRHASGGLPEASAAPRCCGSPEGITASG